MPSALEVGEHIQASADVGTVVPSVLIEIGFLSNKKEEKKILSDQYINNFSKNLALAIENYLLR